VITVRRPTTIRRRLIGDLALLVALTGITILAATWFSGRRTIEDLSTSLIDQTADRTENELHRFFSSVQSHVLIGGDWANAGILDATDHEAMNALFVPILEQHPELSSMMVADSNGAEYLLLRDPLNPHAWSNRVVQADRWGTRVLNRKWDSATGEVDESFGELEYDPRKRIWYREALQTIPTAPVFWTEPVIFFITKDPGITAATHLLTGSDSPHTIVVAYDLLLMDISRFTSNLSVSERSKTFVLVEDNESHELRVVGLPSDTRYDSDAAIRDALVSVPPDAAIADSAAQLPSPGSLNVPSVTSATQRWIDEEKPQQPLRFDADGESWWAGFRSFELGNNVFWIGTVVPEADFSAGIQTQQAVLMGVVAVVLLVGLIRAVTLAGRFSRPIESLVRESERMSHGDLEDGQAIDSNVEEIRRLADAHENMREGLKSVIKLEKLERDLDIARDIQRGLLPDEPPQTPGFEVAGWNRPADKTGGDYFDWLTLPNGRTLFTLADVTGHGIGPALVVAVYRAYMRSTSEGSELDLKTLVGRLNDLLCIDMPEGRFITAAIGIIDPQKQQVELLSAGQAPLLFYEADKDQLHNWDADDLPLGVAEDIAFGDPRRIDFAVGDLLVLTTDGFFEAANAADEQFGIDAVEQFIRDHYQLPPDDFIKRLHQQVKAHSAGQEQADDLTALVIKRGD